MNLGPWNSPAFNTCMMRIFQGKLQILYCSRYSTNTTHLSSFIIIDGILLWDTDLPSLLRLFECVYDVFMKYRVTLLLEKYEFLTTRTNYVGQDITLNGNFPDESNFGLINTWPLPSNVQLFCLFVIILNFYNIYFPFFEIIFNPRRALERHHHRKPIPPDLWTPSIVNI